MELVGKVTYIRDFRVSKVLQNIFIHGTIPGADGISLMTGTFSAAFYNDTMSANVQYSGNIQYELRPSSIQQWKVGFTKTYVMSKVDMEAMYYSKETYDIMKQYNENQFQTQPQSQSTSILSIIHLQSTAHLKILVLYTKQAVKLCPGENCLLARISLDIGNYNLALQNSKVDMTVSFVAERIRKYDTYMESSDMGVMLSSMGSTISTARRNTLRCHAVHLITSNTKTCGMAAYAFNGKTSGYSVSSYTCVGGYMSLAHEVSHNIGLQHDTSGFGGNTPNRGYCWDDATGKHNCHRSVMAYAGCKTRPGKTNCERVKYFSTPNVIEMGNRIGSSGFNNAQQLRNNIINFLNQFNSHFAQVASLPISPTEIPTREPTLSSHANFTFAPMVSPVKDGKLTLDVVNLSANISLEHVIVATSLIFAFLCTCAMAVLYYRNKISETSASHNSMKFKRENGIVASEGYDNYEICRRIASEKQDNHFDIETLSLIRSADSADMFDSLHPNKRIVFSKADALITKCNLVPQQEDFCDNGWENKCDIDIAAVYYPNLDEEEDDDKENYNNKYVSFVSMKEQPTRTVKSSRNSNESPISHRFSKLFSSEI